MVHHRGLLSLDIQLLQAEILEAIDAEGLKQSRLAAEEREKARLRTIYSMSDMQWVKDDLLKRRKGETKLFDIPKFSYVNNFSLENTLRRVYKWLAAPSFSETLQNAQAVRQQGTDSWIFGDQKFQNWIGGSQECQQAVPAKKKRQLSSNVFWIHGMNLALSHNLTLKLRQFRQSWVWKDGSCILYC